MIKEATAKILIFEPAEENTDEDIPNISMIQDPKHIYIEKVKIYYINFYIRRQIFNFLKYCKQARMIHLGAKFKGLNTNISVSGTNGLKATLS